MNEKKYYNVVFCVVVYRNTLDIIDFLHSINKTVKGNYKVIVVNNFYDDTSEQEVVQICNEFCCDFIHSDNNGYGAGNNKAIAYALNKYIFDYLIISNPDIIIKKFCIDSLSTCFGIIAPKINTLSGKAQNPMNVVDNKIATNFIYKGLKNNNKFAIFFGLGINKLIRKAAVVKYKLLSGKPHKIYMAHGSFVMLDRTTVEKLFPLYDSKMFLFAEESYLAIRAKHRKISTWYTEDIQVLHKEDGSMKFRNDINEHLKNSNIYVYEKYYLNKEVYK